MALIEKLARRDFLKISAVAGGGLVLGIRLPMPGESATAAAGPFQPNAFLRIDTDGAVTIWLGRSDMGQGVRTALPMIVADELDADWQRVSIVQADAHPVAYGRMMTVGSSSVRGNAWMALRQAGAAAREMLVKTAARRWNVSSDACRTDAGTVVHQATGRSVAYGDLAEEASGQPVPADPRLKQPSEFRLIGTSVPLVDTRDRVNGRAKFGMDVRLPGMVFATVVHPPVFGARVGSFDDATARDVTGVLDVFEVSNGVAVVAKSTWSAIKASLQLDITWADTAFSMDSDAIFAHFAELLGKPGMSARSDGNADAALAAAASRVSATYRAPYLAHATMEPMNCTAHVRPDGCEIWAPTQNPQGTQSTAARLTGLAVDDVTVHVTYLGCGWGRRSSTDFVLDAVETAMKVDSPVQLVWTREEDMQHDHYRPAALHTLEGGVDAKGHVAALKVRIAAQPIAGRGGRVDGPAVAAIADSPYAIPAFSVEYCRPDLAVPVGYWRSVGPSQNAFIIESFIDELAHTAGRDPAELRVELLAGQPRLKNVVELAARESGWGTSLPAGRARGIACVEDTGSFIAQVAEVSVDNGEIRVHRVTCAADCGRIIHPGIVEAQLAGAVIGGLAAALHGEITIEKGRVAQSNFHDYPLLRMREAPHIDVHIVQSEDAPGGVGEPALPPVAPAVANALFALTGTRVRTLPLRAAALTSDH